MGAFEVAAQLLEGVALSPGQLAQLRAIDRKYQERLCALVYRFEGGVEGMGLPAGSDSMPSPREPTREELGALEAMVTSDLLAMLTPDQRRGLRR
ncbi:MAG TPA: hypothetical protein VNA89_16020 [Gemmatimonadaceae bacterium]|nr:hypothetical protein [Gemmatimonadaceae bacterium]